MQRVFTDEQELDLLAKYRTGKHTHRSLSIATGVDQSTITRVLARASDEARRAKRRARDAKRAAK